MGAPGSLIRRLSIIFSRQWERREWLQSCQHILLNEGENSWSLGSEETLHQLIHLFSYTLVFSHKISLEFGLEFVYVLLYFSSYCSSQCLKSIKYSILQNVYDVYSFKSSYAESLLLAHLTFERNVQRLRYYLCEQSVGSNGEMLSSICILVLFRKFSSSYISYKVSDGGNLNAWPLSPVAK